MKDPTAKTKAPLCPSCREKEPQPQYQPFCSKRCHMLDLGKWLNESYRIGQKPEEFDAS